MKKQMKQVTHSKRDITPATNRKLIIIDWDDTLNPSTWCLKNGVLTVRQSTQKELQSLRELSLLVVNTLKKCMQHGLLVIVTNAEAGWVEASSRTLLPDVYSLLGSIPVISARSTFESLVRDAPSLWKAMTFSRVVSEWSESLGEDLLLGDELPDVLSIGDAQHEREALFHICAQHEVKFRSKSIKLMERPTIDDLKKQHLAIVDKLDAVTSSSSVVDICYYDGDFVDYPSHTTQPRPHTIPAQKRSRARFGSPQRLVYSHS
jgi:hypothetical protein